MINYNFILQYTSSVIKVPQQGNLLENVKSVCWFTVYFQIVRLTKTYKSTSQNKAPSQFPHYIL